LSDLLVLELKGGRADFGGDIRAGQKVLLQRDLVSQIVISHEGSRGKDQRDGAGEHDNAHDLALDR